MKKLKKILAVSLTSITIGTACITPFSNICIEAADENYGAGGDLLDFTNTRGYYNMQYIVEMSETLFTKELTNDINRRTSGYFNYTKDSSSEIYEKVKEMCESGEIDKYLSTDEDGNTWISVSKFISVNAEQKNDSYYMGQLQNSFNTMLSNIFNSSDHYEASYPKDLTEINSNLYVSYAQIKVNLNKALVNYNQKEFEALDYAKIFYALEQLDAAYYVSGDANSDAEVNVRDAAFIAQKLASKKSDELDSTADFNCDSKNDVRDAAALASYLSKKSTVK
ncbi:dockerin type I domain-containing protein [Porcipelethomonas sp.]|uniref:dockerin type I domain-containing protein n=1 Tax=Porcipelethomonas sp. TaxID=2981675 RepID=UPI003EF7A36B